MSSSHRSRSAFFLTLAAVFCLLQADGPSLKTTRPQELGRDIPETMFPVTGPAHAFEEAERLRERSGEAFLRQRGALYSTAIEGWRVAGNLSGEADSWNGLAEVRRSLGDLRGAVAAFDAAILRFKRLDKRDREVEALNSQGRVFRLLGRLD